MGRRARQGPGPTHHPGAREQGRAQARPQQLDRQPDPSLPQAQGRNVTDAVKLAPSILAADFARLGDQVAEAERAGADRIPADVMDGHFVPNISMGAPIIRSLRKVTRLPLEAHLMISDPDFFVDEFARAGTDSFLVHWEGQNDLSKIVRHIKALGRKVGVAINPATSAAALEEILPDIDQVLVMTVNP